MYRAQRWFRETTIPKSQLLQTRWMRQLTSRELRSTFIDYFEKQGHTAVKSASLVPHQDKTLLFTNAGMVPFKEFFLKPKSAPFQSATSIQKCMRAGGKHNDLDNVGYTPRHHTFFEMLGNFSFGRYSKAEAIDYAWKFLLKELELPIHRLRVTVLEGDKEAYDLWKQQGLPDDRIVTCGPEDNFWSMGDGEGPCGSCTEIFWDTQDASLEDPWLEIWNLVFMEKYRTAEGVLTDLPIPCIDTGMGLERMISVLQEKKNNFQIDQFQTLIGGLRQVMQKRGLTASSAVDPSAQEKIITDHFRAMCFLIGDGVVPSNVGRGYVLRRIIRRALRAAKQLGFNEPFLSELYPSLLAGFDHDEYPELASRASSIQSIIMNEETAFLATLDRGMQVLENVFNQADLQTSKQIPPQVAFQLYDTFGFPFDLTLIIAHERGWTIDIEAVEALREKQRQAGKESWKSSDITDKSRLSEWRQLNIKPQFTGYDRALFNQESEILAIDSVQKKNGKTEVTIAIDPCPFYGLGGGQVPDQGTITLTNGHIWQVNDVMIPYEGGLALRIQPLGLGANETVMDRLLEDQACLQQGQLVRTDIDVKRREGAEVHHTATHLLNAGLRQVLGSTDIVQAGSTVEPRKLRFDFTYGKPLKPKELDQIEDWINQAALVGGKTEVRQMRLTDAVNEGAIAAFSEKYGEVVRVIDVPGVTKELCGGTHVTDIKKIYPFKILNETSVAAGTRRIEAVAGLACIDWYRKTYEPVPEALRLLRANNTNEMIDKLEKTMQQTKELQKRLEFMNEKLASADKVIQKPIETKVKDMEVKVHLIDQDLDASFMQKRANVLKEIQPSSVHVLVNKNTIVVALNSTEIKHQTADSVLKQLLKSMKGGGGGQKEMAQGRLAQPIMNQADIESKVLPALQKIQV
ncbi:Alanine--tRNA ligase, mitochondrial [Choanephora cucurbitarum]|uniref:Alanine--tRNA ligase n=1 Tax=Choanephora cucurbitarum TaxID=101091 RepID=A0A1C7N8D8_9FUNG|nr:Alanine--tRNA ligase, mitochondrial [Choanephora cucurbitarum]